MATSGTTAFTLDFTEIAEEAWEQAGREMRSGYDLRTARRSLNLLMVEWQNRGINLWTVDEGSIPLLMGDGQYQLPADTIDIIDSVVRTGSGSSQSDLNLARINVSSWSAISNKLIQGRPIQMWIDRQRDAPVVNVWPVPDRSDFYTMVYWRLRRIEDVGNGTNNPDVNYRFLPALTAGLAYKISMKDNELRANSQFLKQEYEDQFSLAAAEDRDKSSWYIRPGLRGY